MIDQPPPADQASRAMAVKLLQAYRDERAAGEAHALRGKQCPIQRPGLKR
jgi:hypothetical protein